MAFRELTTLDADKTISLGGKNKKTGKSNPASVEGYFLGTRLVSSPKSKNGKAAIHFLQTEDGNLGVWGKTDMDRKLANVNPGTMIQISFDKMVPTPNGEMYKYKVAVDVDNTIEVDLASADTTDAAEGDEEPARGSYADNSEDDSDEAEEESYGQEAVVSTQSLSALGRKQKVEALLKNNKTKRN